MALTPDQKAIRNTVADAVCHSLKDSRQWDAAKPRIHMYAQGISRDPVIMDIEAIIKSEVTRLPIGELDAFEGDVGCLFRTVVKEVIRRIRIGARRQA